jgi:hypothetical protein
MSQGLKGVSHKEMRCLAGAQPHKERVLGVTDGNVYDYSNSCRQALVPPMRI